MRIRKRASVRTCRFDSCSWRMGIVRITYFVHGTTTDNENGTASGWNQGELPQVGKKQCVGLRKQAGLDGFEMVSCSDLKRARDSARLMFGSFFPTKEDKRLRELDYGELNGASSEKVDALLMGSVTARFPGGESCTGRRSWRLKSYL